MSKLIQIIAGSVKNGRSRAARELGISNSVKAPQPLVNNGGDGMWRLSWPDGNVAEIEIKHRSPVIVLQILEN